MVKFGEIESNFHVKLGNECSSCPAIDKIFVDANNMFREGDTE